jgi:O-antigen ligase
MFISLYDFSINSLYQLLQQLAFFHFSVALMFSIIDNKNQRFMIKSFSVLFLIIMVFIFFFQSKYGMEILNDIYATSLFKISFALSFFFIINWKKKIFWPITLFSITALSFGERTIGFVLVLIYMLYIILGFAKNKNKYFFFSIFWFILVLNILCIFCYIAFANSDMKDWLNMLSLEHTNNNFFSGREVIWKGIIDSNKETILLGKGIGNDELSRLYIDLSTHNLYLYLYLEGGIVLLSLFYIFIFSIWKLYFRFIYDEEVRLSAAYFLGILILVNYELILLINGAIVSFFLWLVISFGIIRCNNLKYLIALNRLDKEEK